jgi:acetyl-CoA carboxylase beta subunit
LINVIQIGIGKLNGTHVAFGVMDFQFMEGGMGFVVGENIYLILLNMLPKNLCC